jgi:hypothetical protein
MVNATVVCAVRKFYQFFGNEDFSVSKTDFKTRHFAERTSLRLEETTSLPDTQVSGLGAPEPHGLSNKNKSVHENLARRLS